MAEANICDFFAVVVLLAENFFSFGCILIFPIGFTAFVTTHSFNGLLVKRMFRIDSKSHLIDFIIGNFGGFPVSPVLPIK